MTPSDTALGPVDGLRWVLARLGEQAVPGWLVGGAVRDPLLGRPVVDVDVAVPAGAVALAARLAEATGGTLVVLDGPRDIARVVWSGRPVRDLDIAALCAPTIEADLASRDFTINALAVPLASATELRPADILDPTGGLADLRAGVVRMTAPGALTADPLRTLRAVRFAAELGFRLDEATGAAVQARAALLAHVAGERVREELLRTLLAPGCAGSVGLWRRLGLLAVMLPEVADTAGVPQSPPHDRDVLDHSLAVLDAVETWQARLSSGAPEARATAAYAALVRDFGTALAAWFADEGLGSRPRWGLLRLAALLHDVGKPATRSVDPATGRIHFYRHEQVGATLARQVASRLRFSQRESAYLGTVVAGHLRPLLLARSGPPGRRSVYRYFRATGAAGVDVVLLALADAAGKGATDPTEAERLGAMAAELWRAWFERPTERVRPPPLVRGSELMADLGLTPGPQVGQLLAAIQEAQAAGSVRTAAEALALARTLRDRGPEQPPDRGAGPE